MVKFLKTLGTSEVRDGYLNLTDNARETYGHLFPGHTTRYVVLDHNGRRSSAQQHHRNQVWGTLKNWYRETKAKAGDTVIVSYNANERIDGIHVLHLGLFNPEGGMRPDKTTDDSDAPERFNQDLPIEKEPLLTPMAIDLGEPSLTQRHAVQTYRILRDTALARWLKHMYEYECQLCGMTIELINGGRYAEVHHIQPLGAPHNGPDILENMLVLCPNHHAMCDLGAIRLSIKELRVSKNHPISLQRLEYHNVKILEETAQQSGQPDRENVGGATR